MPQLTVATRNSPLALWQTLYVVTRLKAIVPHYHIQLLPMVTSGDKASKENWAHHTGKGLFVKELEEALLEKRADLAVHSIKDLPAQFPTGLCLAVICERGNPFDAFVSDTVPTLDALPHGATIGTASLRRQAQLKAYRPDLQLHPLRGNVQTRLLKAQAFDGIILAAAGLERLDSSHLIKEILMPPRMIPACGQGAIGIECREADHDLLTLLDNLRCHRTTLCVSIERQINALLGGHCHVPIGIFCTQTQRDQLQIQTRVLSPDGSRCIHHTLCGNTTQATQLVQECVTTLLHKGAQTLIKEASCSP